MPRRICNDKDLLNSTEKVLRLWRPSPSRKVSADKITFPLAVTKTSETESQPGGRH